MTDQNSQTTLSHHSPTHRAAALLERYEGVDPSKVYLTPAEAAALVFVTPKTLETWRSDGRELPFSKLGRYCLYKLSDVIAYRERSVFRSAKEAKVRNRRAPLQEAGGSSP